MFGNVPLELIPDVHNALVRHTARIKTIDKHVDQELLRFETILLRHIPRPLMFYKVCGSYWDKDTKAFQNAEALLARLHLAWKRVHQTQGMSKVDQKLLTASLARLKKLAAALEIANEVRFRGEGVSKNWWGTERVFDALREANMKPHEIGLHMKDLKKKAREEEQARLEASNRRAERLKQRQAQT